MTTNNDSHGFKFVLLIWNEIPENTNLYLIPEQVAKEHESFLLEAHDKLINSNEINDGLKFLNAVLSNEEPDAGFEKYRGIWIQYKQDSIKPISANITTVYYSGFVL